MPITIKQSELNLNHKWVEQQLRLAELLGFSKEDVTVFLFAWMANELGMTPQQLVRQQHADMIMMQVIEDVPKEY